MLRRTRALCACCAIAAWLGIVSTPIGGQGTSGQASIPAERMRLEGTWNFSTLTSLERPAEFAGRATISLREAADYEQRVIERNNADRRDGPADTDVARAYNEAWFDRGTHLAIVNGEARTSLVVDPRDGRIPALTADAARRQSARISWRRDHPADGPEDRSLAERCLSFNAGPPILPGPYNNYLQILVFDRYVIVLNEMIHDARVIPTDGRSHAPPAVRRFLGDPVGRWEGATLIVDSTNFTDKTSFRGASDRLHLVERFTPVDEKTLLYQFTVDDPAAFTATWRAELPMARTDEQIFEYACHEGNEAMLGILRGARYGEQQARQPR
jgi:hypothetical protein